MNAYDGLFLMLLNHLITASVFFHWFTFKMVLSCMLMSSSIFLPIFPISLFVAIGLMSRHVGLVWKPSLRSF